MYLEEPSEVKEEGKTNLKKDIKTFISNLNRKKFENGPFKPKTIDTNKIEITVKMEKAACPVENADLNAA